jgi:SAM-dependent methyltransferase
MDREPLFELMCKLEPPYAYFAWAAARDGSADYMHYGYWRERGETLAQAQENLAALVQSWLPAGAKRILDSGCGLGRTTRDLARRGHDVVGISPDANTLVLARGKYPEVADRLVTVSLQEYRPAAPFDVVLFQESSQYVESPTLFARCAELVRPGGHVVICDEVRYGSRGEAFNRRRDMLAFARLNGFELRRNEVVTRDVLPTRRRLVETLRAELPAMVEAFRASGRDVAAEVRELAAAWDRETALFERGLYGYELFLFEQVGPRRDGLAARLLRRRYQLERLARKRYAVERLARRGLAKVAGLARRARRS